MNKSIPYAIVIVIIIAVLYVAFTYNAGVNSTGNINSTTITTQAVSSSSSANVVLMPVQLTDPPQAPNGTQAILLTYSSVGVHEVLANGTSLWAYGSESGKINLLSIVNVTQVISNVTVSANSTINQVRFNVTSVSIKLNNTNYSVIVPNNQIIAQLRSGERVSQNKSVIIELSPTIATIFTSNSTIFVLVPSVKAIVISNASISSSSNVKIGARFNLNASERSTFENSVPNVSILSSSLSNNNNTTYLSITLKNNGNQSVVLNHLLLKGILSSKVSMHGVPTIHINDSIIENGDLNISNIHAGSGVKTNNNSGLKIQTNSQSSIKTNLNISSHLNSSMTSKDNSNGENNSSVSSNSEVSDNNSSTSSNNDLNATETSDLNIEEHVGINVVNYRTLNFVISQNGTLILPNDYNEFETVGYTLNPNSTVTLSFNGIVSYGNGAIIANISPGNNYSIRVSGEQGASTSSVITAS